MTDKLPVVRDIRLEPQTDRASPRWHSCTNVAAQKFPRVLTASHRGRCVVLKGWWGAGAALLPERQGAEDGFRVVRPFSFVQEPNPSLGWPEWSALKALLVDQGWIAATDTDSVAWSRTRDLSDAVVVVGIVWQAPREAPRLWASLSDWKQPIDDSGPYGASEAPFVLESLVAR